MRFSLDNRPNPIRIFLMHGWLLLKNQLIRVARRNLSVSARRRIARLACWPPVGWVRLGDMRRLKPISREWGSDRGLPIDRYYITQFLSTQAQTIQGHVLEVGSDTYTRAFGGDRVTHIDVLHVSADHPEATIVADLTQADHIPSNTFDCIILTQTLQLIYDVSAALKTVYRILKPGGVALVTVPGISKISRYDMDRWGHYWSFTSCSAQCLFEELFPVSSVNVTAHGNVLAAVAFLHGLATEELRQHELDYFDPDYETLITIRAEKPQCITSEFPA